MSHRFLILAAAVLVGPLLAARAQFPSGRDRSDRGSGGSRFDPNQLFDMMAQGKNVVVRDQLDDRQKFMFDRMAQRMGVTNGQMSREQFVDSMQKRMAERGGGPTSYTITTTSKDGASVPGSAPSHEDINRRAEDRFRQMDKDGDGLLSASEMPESLLAERDKWDANKDGFIDLYEYKAYYQARIQQMQQDRGPDGGLPSGNWGGLPGGQPIAPPAEEETEKRPTVYRAGKLPKDLPAWFAQLDTDNDGQVGLYEWVKGGRDIAEFKKMNRNADGFLTVEDVLRYMKLNPGAFAGERGGGPQVASVGSVEAGTNGVVMRFDANGGPQQMGGWQGGRGSRGDGSKGSKGGGRGPRSDRSDGGGRPRNGDRTGGNAPQQP